MGIDFHLSAHHNIAEIISGYAGTRVSERLYFGNIEFLGG